MRRAEDQPPAPTDLSIPDTLEITGWFCTGDPALELERAWAVGRVRMSYWDTYVPGHDRAWPPPVFTARDGRTYIAHLDVTVRPATPNEVRVALAGGEEPATGAEARPETVSPDLTATLDLEITGWLCTGDPGVEFRPARTAEAVWLALFDVFVPDEYFEWPAPVFTARDGRAYTAYLDVVVRPATPDEIRQAVANELEITSYKTPDRVEAPEGA